MNELVMFKANEHTSLASHGGMHRMPRHLVGQKAVVDIGRYAANMIAGVDILELDANVKRGKIIAYLLLQELTDVLVQDIARGITVCFSILEQVLSCALCHYDDSVPASAHALFQRTQ